MSELPARMRAAWIERPGVLQLRDVPVPRPGRGEVLVKVEAALTCGTDVKTLQRGHVRLPMPGPFGHELAGVVAAVGEGVTASGIHGGPLREGDAVMCVPTAPCNECALCSRGRHNLCPHAVGRMVLGAFADYVLLPERVVSQHVFDRYDLPAAHAALLEPLSCVCQGMQRLAEIRAEHVVILGDGPIALLFAMNLGLAHMAPLVLGRHAQRLDAARGYGARTALTPDDESARMAVAEVAPSGADVVIECVGTPDAWRLATELAAPGGTVMLFGGCAPGARADFDAARLHYDEVTVLSSFHYAPHAVKLAYGLLVSHAFDPAPLITHTLPLDRLHDALELMATRAAIKVAVVP